MFSSVGQYEARTPGSSAAQFVEEAHRQHSAMTYAVAMRATRDSEAAADVAQEAFLKLLSEARQGRRPDNVGAWLCRAATNIVISRARRATVARKYAPRLLDHSMPEQPDTIAVVRESRGELVAALAVLRPAERAALILAAHGVTGPEIARHLGRTHGATRALMCRARTRLRASVAVGSAA